MQLACDQIENSELDVLEYLESFPHSKDALEAQTVIIDDFVDNEDFCDNLREVFVKVTSKVLKNLEPFLETDQPSQLQIPHNIHVERYIIIIKNSFFKQILELLGI